MSLMTVTGTVESKSVSIQNELSDIVSAAATCATIRSSCGRNQISNSNGYYGEIQATQLSNGFSLHRVVGRYHVETTFQRNSSTDPYYPQAELQSFLSPNSGLWFACVWMVAMAAQNLGMVP